MLDLPQSPEKGPIFVDPYPSMAKWKYNGYNINYHFSDKYGKEPKGLFFYFHGMNAHGGSSGYLANNIVKNCGMNAYAIDFTNFGQS